MADEWTKLEIETFAPGATVQNAYSFSGRWAKLTSSILDADTLEFRLIAGKWKPSQSILGTCPPDGYANYSAPDDQLIRKDCLYCALIGKIGGGTADHIAPSTDGSKPGNTFAIGSFSVMSVKDEDRGAPLYIGFNCVQRPLQIWDFDLEIFGCKRS